MVWQTKTVSAFRIKKSPVPLIWPLYSFMGKDWWSVLTTTWTRLVGHERFQDMDYLIPTVSCRHLSWHSFRFSYPKLTSIRAPFGCRRTCGGVRMDAVAKALDPSVWRGGARELLSLCPWHDDPSPYPCCTWMPTWLAQDGNLRVQQMAGLRGESQRTSFSSQSSGADQEHPMKGDAWWFHYKVDLTEHPWAHKAGDPTRRVPALEMFGTLILTWFLLQKGGRSLLRTKLSRQSREHLCHA